MEFVTEIKEGSLASSLVMQVKDRLNKLGYGPLDAKNPTFGPTTTTAVKHFQETNQLLEDGVIGKLTWQRLFSLRANKPVSSTKLRMRALEIANTQLRVREKTGKNDGTEVKAYLKSVGLGQGYAWCQAFVYWCYELAANQLHIPNPIPKTAGVLDHLAKAKKLGYTVVVVTDDPQEGDLGIMDFGKGMGHIFFVEAKVDANVFTIEGNTNDGGSREGDGVYERNRKGKSAIAYLRYV